MHEPLTAERLAGIRAKLDDFASWPATFKIDYRAAWLETLAPRLLDEIARLQSRVWEPADGLWLVETLAGGRHAQRIADLTELDPAEWATFARRIDQIAAAIVAVRARIRCQPLPDGSLRWLDPSARDYAEAIVRAVYAAETEGQP